MLKNKNACKNEQKWWKWDENFNFEPLNPIKCVYFVNQKIQCALNACKIHEEKNELKITWCQDNIHSHTNKKSYDIRMDYWRQTLH